MVFKLESLHTKDYLMNWHKVLPSPLQNFKGGVSQKKA